MPDLRVILVVGVGAGLGGVLRLLVTQFVVARFGVGYAPAATMFINIGGSYLIGFVIETSQSRVGFDPIWRFFLATGVLGGYTTFSTFSYEALRLGTEGLNLTAFLYVVGSVVLGIIAAIGGVATSRAIGG